MRSPSRNLGWLLLAPALVLAMPTFAVRQAWAGVADTPLPTFADGSPSTVVMVIPGIVKRTRMQTEFLCTSLASSNVDIGVEAFDPSGTRLNDVSTGTGALLAVAPGETVTFGTSGTAAFLEDVVIPLSGIAQGSARILASSTEIRCTASILDTALSPPASIGELTPGVRLAAGAGAGLPTLPAFTDGQTATHSALFPGVIKRGRMQTDFFCTSLAATSIDIGVEIFDADGQLLNDIGAGSGARVAVAPGATITFGTTGTAAFFEDEIVAITGVAQGLARVVSTSPDVVCTAYVLDSLLSPPFSMSALFGFPAANQAPASTSTPTITATPTITPTPTMTPTPIPTSTPTATATTTASFTSTPTATATPTATPTPSSTPTVSSTPTATPSPTPHPVDAFFVYSTRRTQGEPRFARFGPVRVVDAVRTADYDVVKPERLGSPAAILPGSRLDETTHLIEYRIKARRGHHRFSPVVNVAVAESCGQAVVELRRPVSLLVPSAVADQGPTTAPDPAAHAVDHYICYKVRQRRGASGDPSFEANPRRGQRVVTDTLETARRHDVKLISKVCLPAAVGPSPTEPTIVLSGPEKGTAKPISAVIARHPATALTCYKTALARRQIAQSGCGPVDAKDTGVRITPAQSRHGRHLGMFASSSFGDCRFDSTREVELCVPSVVELP